MSVKIRLARRGAKKLPFYDIVVIDSRKKRDGKPIEKLGYFNPMVTQETEHRKGLVISTDLVEKWLKNGAIPTETVARKLASIGFKGMEGFLPPKKEHNIGVSRKEIAKIKSEAAEFAKQKAKEKAKAKADKEKAEKEAAQAS